MDIHDIISSGVIEGYVLGTASPEEQAMLECMARSFPEVRQAIQAAQDALEQMAVGMAVQPAADMKDRIWNRLEKEGADHSGSFQETPVVAISQVSAHTGEPVSPRIGNWKYWTAAAAVLMLISVAGNIYLSTERQKTQKEIAALSGSMVQKELQLNRAEKALALLNAPNMRIIQLQGLPQHETSRAIVYWEGKSGKVFLDASTLPATPSGMQYQLWAMVDGKPVDAGLYSSEKDLAIALSTIPKAEAFAITLEKAGGSSVPTMANLFVMGKV